MSRPVANFTRGSQLFEHSTLMLFGGLKVPLLCALTVLALSTGWRLSMLTDHEQTLCLLRIWSWAHHWMGFDPNQPIGIDSTAYGHLTIPIHTLPSYPPAIDAWTRMTALLMSAIAMTLAVVLPIFGTYWFFAARFGHRVKARVHERGALLTTADDLATRIAAYNEERRERIFEGHLGPDWGSSLLHRLFGAKWRLRLLLTTKEWRSEVVGYQPYKVAGIDVPWHLEQSHFMFIGTTGTGKTVSLRDLLSQARERDTSSVVFDLTGAFIEAFYDPSRDVILNPLDSRCPLWSIFHECETQAEFTTAAEALVPSNGGSEDPFWVTAARLLFIEICLKLQKLGKGTNQGLNDELMTAELKDVHNLVKDTVVNPITAPEAARMAEAVRAVFNANAAAIRLLPRSGKAFSIKRWVQGDRKPGSILFLSARYVDMSVSKTLLTSWIDTAMNTLMTLDRTDEVRLWMLVDEMGALYRMPALEKGLQTARNFGGAIVLGVHAFNKIKETYGDNIAITLSSLARSKLVLATNDRETATYGSDIIGHHQYKEMEEGYSYGYNNVRDAVTITPQRRIEPLVLPDEINNLASLDGYIKYPEGLPAAKVTLKYVAYPKVAEAFMPRPEHEGPDWISDDSPRDPDWKRHAEEVGGRAGPAPQERMPAAAHMRATGKAPRLSVVGGTERSDGKPTPLAPAAIVQNQALAMSPQEHAPAPAPIVETIDPVTGEVMTVTTAIPATAPPSAPPVAHDETVDPETGEVRSTGSTEPGHLPVASPIEAQPEQIEDQSIREAREGFDSPDLDVYGPN